jgi:hypothetical protein
MIISLLSPVDQASQSQRGFQTTVIDSPGAQSSSSPSEIGGQQRRRSPEIQISRERLNLLDRIMGELTTVYQQRHKFTGVEALKRKYPDFELWKLLLFKAELVELLTKDFTPKAYAKTLVLRKYGLRVPRCLKRIVKS